MALQVFIREEHVHGTIWDNAEAAKPPEVRTLFTRHRKPAHCEERIRWDKEAKYQVAFCNVCKQKELAS